MFWNYYFIGLFLTISPALMAQQVVSGCITDTEDGLPVVGASVFIANTTIGTATDLDGNYSFTVPGRGSFEIVVSHVGYQSVFYKIDEPKDTHRYDVTLAIAELEEVTVRAAKTYRNSDVNLFWRKILGERPSRSGMEVLNPESIYFYKSNNILKASSREPIEIINHQTGYRIQYILQSFEHDYSNATTTFYGMPYFEELTPLDNRQQTIWEKKRREVYGVSMNRFLRALYRGQIHEGGNLLVRKDSYTMNMMDIETSSSILKSIIQADRDNVMMNIETPLMLINFFVPVNNDLIYKNSRSIREGREFPVVELLPSQIRVYPDGTYSGLLSLGEVNKYVGGLSSRVPVEYPETSEGLFYSNMVLPANDLGKAEENIIAQVTAYPQEKIHLHTDRDFYVPGEKIWFKAYVTDANTHLNTTNSQYVYVELISPADTLVNRVMITQTDDMFFGHLPISETIAEGNYTLRAYTRYMENLGDDYFFKKNIRIAGSGGKSNYELRANINEKNIQSNAFQREAITNYESNNGLVNYEKMNESGATFDISFFPEGGNLPEGVLCKVAFKALNQAGYPEQVTGYLVDESGAEIFSVQTYHAGMGVFTYLPESGKRYWLKCTNGNGIEKRFELPQSNPRAYALATSMQNNKIMIGLLSPFGGGQGEVNIKTNTSDPPLYLLIHCRGTVFFFSEWDGRSTISLMTEDLPAGVIQFVLFDGQMNPLSERLMFSKNEATIPIEFQTDKETYQIRDKVSATLFLTPSLLGRAGERYAHFSVAITDDKDIAVDESTTILSSLLLSSELKGYIENPAYYLQDPIAMDLLMMTHGWRRYNIPAAVQGRLEKPHIPFQQYQSLSGRVNTTGLFNRSNPVPDSEVIIVMKGGGFGVTSTDKKGSFVVPNLEFPDSTTFYIQALTRKGSDNNRLIVDKELYPTLVYAPQSPLSREKIIDSKIIDSETKDAFIVKAKQRVKYEEDMWTIQLKEVVVSAPVIRKKEPRDDFYLNTSSDYTITREKIDEYKFPLVRNYLEMIPGINVEETPDGALAVSFRGLTGGAARIFIDGTEADGYTLAALPAAAIESIDAIKGIAASMLGVRGAGGAVSITTRMGGKSGPEKLNHVVYNPLGYQHPVEFYAPKYETNASRQSPIPDYRTTIFWKPDVVISEDGEASFEFYSSDYPTTYSVVIEGLTNDGKIVRQVEKIVISY